MPINLDRALGRTPTGATPSRQDEEKKKKKLQSGGRLNMDRALGKHLPPEQPAPPEAPKNEPSQSVSKNFWSLDNFLDSIVEAGSLTVNAIGEQVSQGKKALEYLGGKREGQPDRPSLALQARNQMAEKKGEKTYATDEEKWIDETYNKSGINAKRIEQGKKPILNSKDEYAEMSPMGQAINSPTGRKVIGRVARETSNMGIRGLARLESVGSKTYDQALDGWMRARQDPNNPVWKQTLYAIQDSAPQALIGMLITVGTTALTRGRDRGYAGLALSSAYYGALSANEQLEERGRYESPGNVAIDVFGDQIINASLGKILEAPAASILKEGIKGFGIEGGTEVSQTLAKYANDYKNATTEEEKQRVKEAAARYVKEGGIAVEFMAGGVAGGLGSVATGAYANVANQSGNAVSSMPEEAVTPSKPQTPVQEAPPVNGRVKIDEPIETTEAPVETAPRGTTAKQAPTGLPKKPVATTTTTEKPTVKATPENIGAIRDALTELSQAIDNLEGQERQDAVDRINELMPAVNDFNSENSEDIIRINDAKRPKAVPDLKVELVEYPDGKFATAIGYQFSDRGMGNPFGGTYYNSRAEAIATTLDNLEARIRSEMARSDFRKTDLPRANKMLAAIAQARSQIQTAKKAPAKKPAKKKAKPAPKESAKAIVEKYVDSHEFPTEGGLKYWLESGNLPEGVTVDEAIDVFLEEYSDRPVEKAETEDDENGIFNDASTGKPDERGSNTVDFFEYTPDENPDIKEGSAEFKLFEKAQEFVTKYAERLSEGYQRRNTNGWYDSRTHNLFVNGRNNISTIAHEVMHHVDTMLKLSRQIIQDTRGDSDTIRQDLQSLYFKYYGGPSASAPIGRQVREGMATLMQRYAEMPSTIEAEYPRLVDAVLQPGGKYYNPVFTEMIDDLRSISDTYNNLSNLDKTGARVQNSRSEYNQRKEDKFMDLKTRARHEVYDNIFGMENLDQKVGIDNTEKSVSLWMRFTRGWHAIAAQNILGKKNFIGAGNDGYYQIDAETGEVKKTLDFNWNTLVSQLEKRGESEDFGYWLVDRRVHFEYKRLDEINNAIEVTKSMLAEELEPEVRAELQAKFNALTEEKIYRQGVIRADGITREVASGAFDEHKARFEKPAEMYDKLTRQDVEMMYQARLIDKATRNEYMENTGYASFKREIFNEIVGSEDGLASQNVKIGGTKIGATLRRKGGQQAIINPLHNGITNHMEITKKSLKQIVNNKILDELVPLAPQLFQSVPVVPSVGANGNVTFPQEKSPDIIMARDPKGKRVALLTNKDLKTVVENTITINNHGVVKDTMTFFNRLFTKGTTAFYYAFAPVNFLIDQLTAAVNTRNNYIPILSGLNQIGKALYSRAVNGKGGKEWQYWQEYMIVAGDRRTMAGWQDDSAEEAFKHMTTEASKLRKAAEFAQDWTIGMLAKPSQYSEIFTRYAEYAKARSKGKPVLVAMEEAGRVTAPFHHIGNLGDGNQVGQFWIHSLPFANAGLQVTDQFFRTLKTKEGKARAGLMIALLMSAKIAEFVAMQDASDEQKEQYRDLDPALLARYVYLPKKGGSGLYRVRIPENLGWYGAALNMALGNKMMSEGVDYTAKDFLEGATTWIPQQMNPFAGLDKMAYSYVPQAFKPGMLTMLGVKDFPTIQPIESMSVSNLPVTQRTSESTSALAKWLSEKTGGAAHLSPLKWDYLITGYFGRASGYFTGKPDAYNPLKGTEQDYYFKSGRLMQEYYKVKSETEATTASVNQGMTTLDNDSGPKYEEAKDAVKQTDKLLKKYKEIPMEETEDLAEIRKAILENAQRAVEANNR